MFDFVRGLLYTYHQTYVVERCDKTNDDFNERKICAENND